MAHGHTIIESKGACIYCGRSDIALTDEHVVPLSLGGQLVISDASCDSCAKITGRFEQEVARGLWGDARISYGAPSRRKKLRATHITLVDPTNPNQKVRVPYSDYPAPMVFYRMNKAGLLSGFPESVDLARYWLLEAIHDDAKAKEFEKKYGVKLTSKFKHVPDSFAQLIAKIGYGQVLTQLDPADFNPICVPYILGQKKNPSFIVGGSSANQDPDIGKGYVLSTAGFGTNDRLMIVAEVRLFANNHTPIYHVIVGDVVGKAPVEAALKKIGSIDLKVFPSSGLVSLVGPHWLPQVWPLPYWNRSA